MLIFAQGAEANHLLGEFHESVRQGMRNSSITPDNVRHVASLIRVLHENMDRLSSDQINFLTNYLNTFLLHLPTVEQFRDLIDMLADLNNKKDPDSGFKSAGDFFSKFGKPPGPSGSGGPNFIPPS
jgi:hypothetical protein